MSMKLNAGFAAMACTTLSACYVVPVQHYPASATDNPPHQFIAAAPLPVQPAPVARPPLLVRLYPTNSAAAAIGMVSGSISNFERGRGEFIVSVGSETYQGEATRSPNSTKGSANASGNRGGYVKCDYTMTSATIGSGSCQFSGGARFDLHVSG